MKRKTNGFQINRISKKGVTLPEVIVSILFTAIIFTTAISIWFTAGKVFGDTEDVSKLYGDARVLETMLQNAASVAPSAAFTSNLESSEAIFGNTLPAGKTQKDYFRFYYDESKEAFCVSYYVEEPDEPMIIGYGALSNVNDVRIGFSTVGNEILMKYQLALMDNGSYFIEGGIILSYAETGPYPSMRHLDYNLYLHVE
ncbi:MAG: hypothetical protein WCX60_08120 [Anaerovoracaceae bacterium]